MSSNAIETEFLVVGAGPAGAGLASFLGQNGERGYSQKPRDLETPFTDKCLDDLGLKGIVIAAAPGTADTPRAHLNNPFVLGELPSSYCDVLQAVMGLTCLPCRMLP